MDFKRLAWREWGKVGVQLYMLTINHAKNGLYASIDHKLKSRNCYHNEEHGWGFLFTNNDFRASYDCNLIYRGGLCTMLELEEGPSSWNFEMLQVFLEDNFLVKYMNAPQKKKFIWPHIINNSLSFMILVLPRVPCLCIMACLWMKLHEFVQS